MTTTTNDAGPEQNHTRECLDMGWWLLHDPGTSCDERSDPDDPQAPALPVLDDELRLTDGTTARVLQRYDATLSRIMTGTDLAWQVTGPTGARVISQDDVAGYVADEASDVEHAAALVINAAINWENAINRLEHDGSMIASADAIRARNELRETVRAYLPLVTG